MIRKVKRSRQYSDNGDKEARGYYDDLHKHRREKRFKNALRSKNAYILEDLEDED